MKFKIIMIALAMPLLTACASTPPNSHNIGAFGPSRIGNSEAINEYIRERNKERRRVHETYRVRIGAETHTIRVRGNSVTIH